MSSVETFNKAKTKNKNTICKTKFKGKIEQLRGELTLKDIEIEKLKQELLLKDAEIEKLKEGLVLKNSEIKRLDLIPQIPDVDVQEMKSLISKYKELEENNRELQATNQDLKSKHIQLEITNQQLLANYNLAANLYNGLLTKQETINTNQSSQLTKINLDDNNLLDLEGPDYGSGVSSILKYQSTLEPFCAKEENLTSQLISQLQDNYKQGRIKYQTKDNQHFERLDSNTLEWLTRLDRVLDMHCYFRPDLRILKNDLWRYSQHKLIGLNEEQFHHLMGYRVDGIRINNHCEAGQNYYIGLSLLDDYRLINPELISRIYSEPTNQDMIGQIREFIERNTEFNMKAKGNFKELYNNFEVWYSKRNSNMNKRFFTYKHFFDIFTVLSNEFPFTLEDGHTKMIKGIYII